MITKLKLFPNMKSTWRPIFVNMSRCIWSWWLSKCKNCQFETRIFTHSANFVQICTHLPANWPVCSTQQGEQVCMHMFWPWATPSWIKMAKNPKCDHLASKLVNFGRPLCPHLLFNLPNILPPSSQYIENQMSYNNLWSELNPSWSKMAKCKISQNRKIFINEIIA